MKSNALKPSGSLYKPLERIMPVYSPLQYILYVSSDGYINVAPLSVRRPGSSKQSIVARGLELWVPLL